MYYLKADGQVHKSTNLTDKLEKMQGKINTKLRCLILDFSSVSHIDPSGVSMLKSVVENFTKLGIPVYIASCKGMVLRALTTKHTFLICSRTCLRNAHQSLSRLCHKIRLQIFPNCSRCNSLYNGTVFDQLQFNHIYSTSLMDTMERTQHIIRVVRSILRSHGKV